MRNRKTLIFFQLRLRHSLHRSLEHNLCVAGCTRYIGCAFYQHNLCVAGCTDVAATSACAIPIRHRAVGTGDHYAKVNAWSKGDNYLDWYGAEAGQGTFGGRPADGTPAVWTTNDLSHPGHSQFNT